MPILAVATIFYASFKATPLLATPSGSSSPSVVSESDLLVAKSFDFKQKGGEEKEAVHYADLIDNALHSKGDPCPEKEGVKDTDPDHVPAPPPNPFEAVKDTLKQICTIGPANVMSWVATSGFTCDRFVSDYFSVASPRCNGNKSDAGAMAGSCTIGLDYILDQLKSRPECAIAIDRLDRIIANELSNVKTNNPKSMWDLAMLATNGDRELAILIISAGYMSSGGLQGIASMLTNDPAKTESSKKMAEIFRKWGTQRKGNTLGSILQDKYPGLSDLPDQFLPNGTNPINEGKSYHFWARALIASGLKKKGYPSWLSKTSSTFSAVAYEYYFDFLEHVQQDKKSSISYGDFELSYTDYLRINANASSDLRISRLGSQFGVGDL